MGYLPDCAKKYHMYALYIVDGCVSLKNYEASAAGLIESNIDRFKSSDVENILLKLWEKELPYQEC